MSIYSGFATRNLQESYDQYVCDLLFVLQKRLLKFYQNLEADEDKFYTIFSQLYHQILHLQKSKYLEPKSSVFVNEIFQYLKQKKQQRLRCPEQDLKKFQRSLALKEKKQEQLKFNQFQVNNFIRRSSYSFGKIKRQFDSSTGSDLKQQIPNRKNQIVNKSFQNPEQRKLISEQKSKQPPKRIFSSKGYRNSKSYQEQMPQNFNDAKIKISGSKPAEEIVKQYLQKTNKNYIRGYRKRKINHEFDQSNQNPKSIMRHKRHSQC